MQIAKVDAAVAGRAIKALLKGDFVDRRRKIDRSESEVMIPLKRRPTPELIRKHDMRIENLEARTRRVRREPYTEIKKALAKAGLDKEKLRILPDKWELLGDVAVIRLPDGLLSSKKMIAEAYADVLRVKSVLHDLGNIHGVERLPEIDVLYGDDTETTLTENGVRFSLDAARIMFSSGNQDERLRMSKIACDDEIILDMFAGIGYLSLPMAVHQNPKRIHACEIRELSYDYLRKNVRLNDVDEIVVPFLGDNRDFKVNEKVDRIIMGYLKETHLFLPKALDCLKSRGIIHYHENCPNELLPDRPVNRIAQAAGSKWRFEILRDEVVKSYSPGVSHVSIDARFIRT